MLTGTTSLAGEIRCDHDVFDLPVERQREVAIHEAAHAIAAWLFREQVMYATLVSTDEYLGYVRYAANPTAAYRIKAGLAHEDEILRRAVVNLSGPCAEGLMNGEPNWSDLKFYCEDEPKDFSEVRNIPGMTDGLLSRCYAWTERTVEHSRVSSLISSLAPKLLTSVTLSGDEVDAILRQEWPDAGEWPYQKLGAKWKRWL